jgi:hypothetical protein
MGEQPALALRDRFAAVRGLAEAVIGARDHVQALRVARAIEEGAPVRGRNDLVQGRLYDEDARDAGGGLGLPRGPRPREPDRRGPPRAARRERSR